MAIGQMPTPTLPVYGQENWGDIYNQVILDIVVQLNKISAAIDGATFVGDVVDGIMAKAYDEGDLADQLVNKLGTAVVYKTFLAGQST